MIYSVEDDAAIRELIVYALRQAGYEAEGFEDAIRNAISIGGDSDTIACIAGSIAGAFFGVPDDLKNKALDFIAGTDLYAIYKDFCAKFAR